jgi:16S rRNA processing protein RimM
VPDGRIQMGVIGRPHGVRGLLHVHSFAEDPASLAQYGVLTDDRGRQFSLSWKSEGVAELTEHVDGAKRAVRDREAAEQLVNVRLFVPRDRLPAPAEDEFYLADLVGRDAVGADGAPLGRIEFVHDYGAGASLEIGPLLVPFTKACVPNVDLAAGQVTVVPPAETIVPETATRQAAR